MRYETQRASIERQAIFLAVCLIGIIVLCVRLSFGG
jgi:hypothetical protein